MIEESFVRLRTHRNNVHRYRQLLKTMLRTQSVSLLKGAFWKKVGHRLWRPFQGHPRVRSRSCLALRPAPSQPLRLPYRLERRGENFKDTQASSQWPRVHEQRKLARRNQQIHPIGRDLPLNSRPVAIFSKHARLKVDCSIRPMKLSMNPFYFIRSPYIGQSP